MEETTKSLKALDVQSRSIVKNVLSQCRIEFEMKQLQCPITDYKLRASVYMGLPLSVISKIQENEYVNDNQVFDSCERMLVLKALLLCYTSNDVTHQIPDIQFIYENMKQHIQISNADHLYYKLSQMGFDYRDSNRGPILCEDMKLVFDRYNYLKKMQRLKSVNSTFYYIDERVIESTLQFPKPNKSVDAGIPNSKGTYYLYHCFSNNGLENYLLTNQNCIDTYMKWVVSILLKGLKPGGVIIIDDHPLHGKLMDETITRYHTKSDMINWLKRHNIPFTVTMQKPELYELIRKCNKPSSGYSLDNLLRAHGFDVMRLPYGCNNMTPSALLWKQISTKISLNITRLTALDLEDKLVPKIKKIHESSWKKLLNRIDFWEEQFIDIHNKTETALDSICKFDVHKIVNY